eukprot:CAMPEP_0203877490 /NCGR_PEP_ID=MMETSP0359-20131031/22090_1 /ASSEMBLY_ACC=CAM_ASM_000338 /TAXON_ID=268821 /ORGANISM="Scrippsiella Hangoei, Strain SHTV-5" /LENGTH=69 /DNA_ID=CAMNT_0050796457 /DNA_START=144 /DNA_END=350 /DNA_ORIENTATION=-
MTNVSCVPCTPIATEAGSMEATMLRAVLAREDSACVERCTGVLYQELALIAYVGPQPFTLVLAEHFQRS